MTFTIPKATGATRSGTYNEQEIAYWDTRLAAIEKLLELDTRYAGLGMVAKAASALSGSLDVTNNSESLTATGAVSITKLNTNLDGTSGALTMTLAAPSADGQIKLIQLTNAAHSATVSGTNVQGQSGKTGTFSTLGDALVLISLGGKWVILGGSVSFA